MTDPKHISQHCIMQHLRATTRQITQLYEEALRPENLTASQFSTLVALACQQGVQVSVLAERVGMDRTTLNRVLTPLERRDLIAVSVSVEDARSKAVHLRPEGEKTLERAITLWDRVQERVLQKVGSKAWPELRSQLEQLRND